MFCDPPLLPPLLADDKVAERLQPLNAREHGRERHRIDLLQRRGVPAGIAQAWARRLALRDQERDPRRCCVECANAMPGNRCKARQPVAHGVLMHCHLFAWEKP